MAASTSRRAIAGMAAAHRAGAEFRGRAAVRLRLHYLHGLSFLHRFEDAAELRAWSASQLRAAVETAALVARAEQSRYFRVALHHHLHGARASARHPARSENQGEGVLRPIYLYPMALSFIVTGTAWKWFLDPGIGLEQVVQSWGFETFRFNWIKDRNMAIYTVVLAAVWQSSGFVMAMFLADFVESTTRSFGPHRSMALRLEALPSDHHSHAAADFSLRLHRARASGDQILRSGGGADQWRTRAGRRNCRPPSCTPIRSRATRWASAPHRQPSC